MQGIGDDRVRGLWPSLSAWVNWTSYCYFYPMYFQTLKRSESDLVLVLLTAEGALLPSRVDASGNISFRRWRQGASKRDCGPKKRSSPMDRSPSHISRKSRRRMRWDGMNPHVHMHFEHTKMCVHGITLYACVVIAVVDRAADAERTSTRAARKHDGSRKYVYPAMDTYLNNVLRFSGSITEAL